MGSALVFGDSVPALLVDTGTMALRPFDKALVLEFFLFFPIGCRARGHAAAADLLTLGAPRGSRGRRVNRLWRLLPLSLWAGGAVTSYLIASRANVVARCAVRTCW